MNNGSAGFFNLRWQSCPGCLSLSLSNWRRRPSWKNSSELELLKNASSKEKAPPRSRNQILNIDIRGVTSPAASRAGRPASRPAFPPTAEKGLETRDARTSSAASRPSRPAKGGKKGKSPPRIVPAAAAAAAVAAAAF